MKNKKIFTGNYYICKKIAMILIVLIVFTGCGQNRITEKEEKKETVESEMNAEVKKAAQTFRSVYMKEKSELNTLKVKRKIINCLEEKGYAAVDCDNQIDMVNREKIVKNFCKVDRSIKKAAGIKQRRKKNRQQLILYNRTEIRYNINLCIIML